MSENRVAVVTGGNRGLGLEIARQLAAQGIKVVLTARDEAKAKAAAEELRSEGLEVAAQALDVTKSDDSSRLAKFLSEKFGRLDILINNAGVGEKKKDSSVDEFRSIVDANLVGPYAVTEALLPMLQASPAGRIVNQSSVLGSLSSMSKGQGGDFMTPAYTTSKAALNMLTVFYAQRLKDTNVKVNAAHPGWVKTDMGGPNAQMEIPQGAKTAVRLATLGEDGPTGGFFHLDRVMPW